jgi:Holliday junction resolvase-like predicted endonuclease
MFQIEVKAKLVEACFPPSEGWRVTVDIDPMERATGGTHPAGKKEIAEACLDQLRKAGVQVGPHAVWGRVDIVAEKLEEPIYFVEVEADTKKQREQALYSALGQLLLLMEQPPNVARYCLATPDTKQWRAQFAKVPDRVVELLGLEFFLVSRAGVTPFGRLQGKAD